MTKREHDAALVRRAEKFSSANEARHDQTRQRRFERGMMSFDRLVEDLGDESAAFSDRGRGVWALTRQIDAPSREAWRIACMNQAAARLPRSSGVLRPLLWAIYRNGRNRRQTMAELGLSKRTYWWGVKFFLNFFQAQ